MEKYKGENIIKLNLEKFLLIQTAFIGDVILTLPLAQLLKKNYPESKIDFLTIGRSSEVLKNHPDISSIIIYEKHTQDKGLTGLSRIIKKVKQNEYQVAIIPHRSIKSALIAFLAGIQRRIGFNRSAGKFLLTDIIQYENNIHEIERNLNLVKNICEIPQGKIFPKVYPDEKDIKVIDKIFHEYKIYNYEKLICVAPGSVWNTKMWTKEGYIELINDLISKDFIVFLIGSKTDYSLCENIRKCVKKVGVINLAGELSILQSAKLIERSAILISNDSAPVHLATAVGTPVIAIFGPTSPRFGFSPYSEKSVVVEVEDLYCRPCRIHGSRKCPTGKFECMTRITHERVLRSVDEIIRGK